MAAELMRFFISNSMLYNDLLFIKCGCKWDAPKVFHIHVIVEQFPVR